MTLETLTLIHETAFAQSPDRETVEAWSAMTAEELADDVDFMVARIEMQAAEYAWQQAA